MSSSPLVELRNVTFRYPAAPRDVLSGVQLGVAAGDRLLITGPSGTGKSTLLALIAGFVPKWVPGSVTGTIERNTEAIAFVFQNPEAQMVAPRVEEEIAFGLENLSTPLQEMRRRIGQVMERFGISGLAQRTPAELSGGELQKVALASAIAIEPELLLLDEPTSYLDPDATEAFFELLEELSENTAVVIVEHKVDHAERFAQRLITVEGEGTVTEIGSTTDMDRNAFLPWRLNRIALPSDHRSQMQSGPNGSAPLRVEAVHHAYRAGEEVLKGITFAVGKGETVAVMGPNGAGKSTLLEKVAGTLTTRSGKIQIGGAPVSRMKTRERFRHSLFLPQNPEHFFLRELVEDELRLAASATPAPGSNNGSAPVGKSIPPAAEQLEARMHDGLDRFRLSPLRNRNPYTLSEGEKRRLNLACAFLDERNLLLLDEPTFGLDFSAFEELVASLRTLKADGRSVLLVTHSPELAFLAADRILYLEHGSLVFEGSPSEATRQGSSFPESYLPVWERQRSPQK